MSTEIKIEQNPVKQAVTTLRGSTQSFESSIPDKIAGENQLDLLEKINELNHSYSSLIKSYQLRLLEHINATEDSVETFMETDQTLANYYQFLDL